MSKKHQKTPKFDRPVEQYFHQLDMNFKNRGLYALFITLLFFGVLGLIWMIPFPQLSWLQRINAQTFLNWGSFYIAIIIYLYLKLAPTLSYAVLFSIGVMSFFIVQLEYVERDGGPAVWVVCLALAVVGWIGIWLTSKNENRTYDAKELWQLVRIGPIWLWSKVFEKLNIKY